MYNKINQHRDFPIHFNLSIVTNINYLTKIREGIITPFQKWKNNSQLDESIFYFSSISHVFLQSIFSFNDEKLTYKYYNMQITTLNNGNNQSPGQEESKFNSTINANSGAHTLRDDRIIKSPFNMNNITTVRSKWNSDTRTKIFGNLIFEMKFFAQSVLILKHYLYFATINDVFYKCLLVTVCNDFEPRHGRTLIIRFFSTVKVVSLNFRVFNILHSLFNILRNWVCNLVKLKDIKNHLKASVDSSKIIGRWQKAVKMFINYTKGRFMVDRGGKCFIITNNL